MGSDEDSHLELPHGPGTKVSWLVRVATPDETGPSLLHVQSMLDIEQAINASLSEHAEDVVRVVHTLTARKFHLGDGSTIAFDWEPQINDWRCVDCGIDTDAIAEYYMLSEPVWQQAAADDVARHMCIGCVEQRLGRTLTAADFTDRDVNTVAHLQRSPRLAARIQAHPAVRADGRSPSRRLTTDTVAAARALDQAGTPRAQIARTLGISRSSVYRYLDRPPQRPIKSGEAPAQKV